MANLAQGTPPDWVFLDTETTGCTPARHQVLTLALVRTTPGLSEHTRWECAVQLFPGIEIDPGALRVNGLRPLDPSWNAHARPPQEVAQGMLKHLEGATVVAHNAAFDTSMLRALCTRAGVDFEGSALTRPAVCTVEIARRLLVQTGKARAARLSNCCDYFGISNAGAHTALADTLRCLEVYRRLRALEPEVRKTYAVYVGIYGASNPGPHAVGMVVVEGANRNEWARVLENGERTTAPEAWYRALGHAKVRVNRPDDDVRIYVRDKYLAAKDDTPGYDVEWLPKADGNREMERAHELARGCL